MKKDNIKAKALNIWDDHQVVILMAVGFAALAFIGVFFGGDQPKVN